jgi:RNA recognition motif-containing protein
LAKTLYVGNLPFKTSDEDLTQFFSQYGTVASVKIITDRQTGRSKGFAFVDMDSDEEAQAAIDGANGADFGGRSLRVNEARPPQPRQDGR